MDNWWRSATPAGSIAQGLFWQKELLGGLESCYCKMKKAARLQSRLFFMSHPAFA
jgi:hypothetical protein